MVAKPSPILPKKNSTDHLWSIRKRRQRRLFLLRFISHPLPLNMWALVHIIDFVYSWTLRFLHNLCSAAFDVEVCFSWRWMCQDSGDCWCNQGFLIVPFFLLFDFFSLACTHVSHNCWYLLLCYSCLGHD
jgi:hypothetical protein